jgi:hypothetical protein
VRFRAPLQMEKNKRKHSDCYSITFMISTAALIALAIMM